MTRLWPSEIGFTHTSTPSTRKSCSRTSSTISSPYTAGSAWRPSADSASNIPPNRLFSAVAFRRASRSPRQSSATLPFCPCVIVSHRPSILFPDHQPSSLHRPEYPDCRRSKSGATADRGCARAWRIRGDGDLPGRHSPSPNKRLQRFIGSQWPGCCRQERREPATALKIPDVATQSPHLCPWHCAGLQPKAAAPST
jgi:hypothetical protein